MFAVAVLDGIWRGTVVVERVAHVRRDSRGPATRKVGGGLSMLLRQKSLG
jgi:hypothetical protein